MKYIEIESKRIKPNEHNPNSMTDKRYGILKENIKINGVVHPLLVREVKGGYEIIDGEHRYKVGIELKLDTLPCIVVDLDDVDTKLQTLNMNGIRGHFDVDKLDIIIAELEEKYSFEEIMKLTAVEREIELVEDETPISLEEDDLEIPEKEEIEEIEKKEKIIAEFSVKEHELFMRAVAKTGKEGGAEAVMYMVDFLTNI